ncbi:MAG: DUF1631 family protein [Spongiibacteraceae bacterium]
MEKPPSMDERAKLLQGCKALIFKWVSVHFKSYLEKMDEQLRRMAEKAGSNQEQNRYFQAHRVIREHRRPIEKHLLEHLGTAFRHYLERKPTATDIANADTVLALVDNDALERSIALGTMTRRASADYADALYALNQRLSVIGGGNKISDQDNPVAPGVFAECLQGALQQLPLETPALLVVYKLYDGAVMARLGKLYDLLNHSLKGQGVLTHLRYQVRKHEPPMLPEELAELVSEKSALRQNDLMETVQRLQAALTAGRMHVPMITPAMAMPTPLLVQELHPLQQHTAQVFSSIETPMAFAESDFTLVPPEIDQQKQHANPIDANVIEIVGLLFDYVLNDEQLPDSVKALLSYLHTPFLKMALLDREFFNHPQHPARLLLNSLVAAGERWVEPEGKHRSDVFQQIKSVVKRILDEFDDDVRLFSQLAFEFNHYLRQHVRRVRLAEQRALQAARGEDKLKEIRLKVERYLEQKTGAASLPVEMHTLLFEPWANVLAFNLLRFGSKSEQWRDHARIVDEVLRYLRGEAEAAPAGTDARPWQERLEERLLDGFKTVGYEADQGQRLLLALHRYRERNRQQKIAATPERAVDIDTLPSEPPPDDPILQRLDALEFGTWFLFRADQPARLQYRTKLAWYNARTQHFMFVNRLGQQTSVRLGADLAADIRAGRVRILQQIDDKPFFEKALERIAEQLRLRPR